MISETQHTESFGAIRGSHGQASTADQDAFRQSENLEAAQSETSETRSDGDPEPQDASPAASKDEAFGTRVAPGLPIRRRGKATRRKTGKTAEQYRKLFNDAIHHLVDPSEDSESLLPSQIGASYWTSHEKAIFFAKLAVYGPSAPSELSRAVGTKSPAEIRVYIELLQAGLTEATATQRGADTSSTSELPIAHEIHPDLERALDESAGSLARRIEELDAAEEYSRYGEEWLIDEEVAEALEAAHEGHVSSQDDEVNGGSASSLASDSAALLRPSAFVTLSSNVFMNAPPGHQTNWRELDTEEQTGPAIYHSAFDDFHSLAVTLTRRLVAAVIFQTTSRLRASSGIRGNWDPVAEVTTADARAAAEALGLTRNWHGYWANLPRRHSLSVVTDIRKYKDGRPGAKGGVTLTLSEAEEELGLVSNRLEDHALAREDSVGAVELDSDDLTDISVLGETSGSDEDLQAVSPDPEAEFEPLELEAREGGQRKKRKRALSPGEHVRAEIIYLEALDTYASRRENRRLAELLDIDFEESVQQMLPDRPSPECRFDVSVACRRHWTVDTQYVSQWEHSRGWPDAASFAQMQALGEARRHKRRRVREETAAEYQSNSTGMIQESSSVTEAEDSNADAEKDSWK